MHVRRLVPLVLVAALVAGAGVARAQVKPGSPGLIHRWDGVSLQDALYELADVAGVSLVFAHRLVEGQTVSAQYKEGEEPDAALAALLDGTGLRAERIRRGRYVILAEPLNVLVEPDDPAAYTGVLEGRVVDAETGEALWGAHAWLVDLELGGVADHDGSFLVPDLPTGEYTVRFSHVGYRPVRVRLAVYPLSPQLPPTIRLQPEVLASDDATVRGDLPEPEPGMTELASRQAAALPIHLGEGDLGQALAWLPGLARDGSGGLSVRGADPSLTRYLRDGVPFVEPWHAYGLFSALQPEAYRRVRFHRGSLPAELGGGLAGVVEVETKDGLVERPTGVAALSPLSARAVAEMPLSPTAGLLLAGRGSLLDGLFAPTLRREAAAVVLDPLGLRAVDTQDVAHGFYDAEAKLTWAPEPAHQVAVGGYLGADRLDARLPVVPGEALGEAARLAVDDA
ncbi:MAG: TonB-dependent receptor, partial [Rubricoccaceae bacterium]|nr:TonB-dependent receptor [Rubricoccaceae bacterium]